MLSYNEIKPGKLILFEGEPYQVMESHVFRKQQRKPVNQTKMKHLKTGKVVEYSFHQSEKVEEVEVNKRELKYLYQKRDEVWFCAPDDPSDRIMLSEDVVSHALQFIRPEETVMAVEFDDEIFSIEIPVKVHLKVRQAPPNIKGNTSSGGSKKVTLETGYIVDTPLFIETGDIIEVNTETGEYVTRVEKR